MIFSAAEYSDRLRRVRDRMQTQGLSALLVADPANIYYLTGYNAWSFYTPQVLFVPREGEMIFFARQMDADGAFRTTWLPAENIYGYPERYIHRPYIHPFDWVMFKLRELGLTVPASEGHVGLEMDAHFFSPKAYRAIVNAVPEWSLVDCFELVNWVRVVKSSAEIQHMRQAGMVCSEAMNAAIDNVRVGMRQCDLAAKISAAQISGTPEFGGDYPAIVPMIPTGVEADTPHLTWNSKPFESGQAVVLELSGAFERYHTPLARTVSLGKPSAELDRVSKATDEALNAVIDVTQAGVPVNELARTWNWTLAKHGLEKPSRIGYSIGIGYPPDWGERTVSLRSEDETVLEENMTFHLIGGMWMDGFGYELSEPIRVTESGIEAFTSFPRHLICKEG
ncbi:M24 family metallopeptidase [Saxibacter everestensis]|uniref:M24 family metallopeptidase n=1 Tax=Saxibacter everestensis TaxID=2909229 RepID=A0ABY8QT09_9MICO|nr:M24 family metallopeptidase [Brevibacteriaceae bacterium ZFBP1038]